MNKKNMHGADKIIVSELLKKTINPYNKEAQIYYDNLKLFRLELKSREISTEEARELAAIIKNMTYNLNSATFYYQYILMAFTKNLSAAYSLPANVNDLENINVNKITCFINEAELFNLSENRDLTIPERIERVMRFRNGVNFIMEVPIKLISAFASAPDEKVINNVQNIPTTHLSELHHNFRVVNTNHEIDHSSTKTLNKKQWNKFELVKDSSNEYIRQSVIFPLTE